MTFTINNIQKCPDKYPNSQKSGEKLTHARSLDTRPFFFPPREARRAPPCEQKKEGLGTKLQLCVCTVVIRVPSGKETWVSKVCPNASPVVYSHLLPLQLTPDKIP